MATFRRSLTPGGTYFFTVTTHRRQHALTDPQIYAALKMAIQRVKTSHPFDIEAFVLLPDHLHCIWRLPPGDMNYAMRWSMIKRQVSQAVRDRLAEGVTASRRKRRELGLWQRRFWEHQIRDEHDLRRHIEYIHFNPVKHGYVRRVRDWPYSSFHAHVRQGLCSIDWAGCSDDGRVYGEALGYD